MLQLLVDVQLCVVAVFDNAGVVLWRVSRRWLADKTQVPPVEDGAANGVFIEVPVELFTPLTVSQMGP